MSVKLVGIGSRVCVRKFFCEVVRVTRGGCVLRVLTGRMANTMFTAPLSEVFHAQCG
jgi:hypothetical protein